ncbi:hypothetical protein BH10BAC2_BH10BAC2_26290 [soil metagenome]
MKSFFSSLAVITLMLTACNSTSEPAPAETVAAPAFNLDSVKTVIAASNKMYGNAFINADSAIFINSYTSDACIMAPNMPALCGTEGVAGFYKAAYNMMGVRNLALATTQVYGSGDYITEEGTYELFAAENKSLDKGKFLVLWKKTDAGWKMYRDIFNSDNPPPPAAK